MFGLGCLLGPSLGSFVNGAAGYEITWYYFAVQTLVFLLINLKVLPDSLDEEEEEETVQLRRKLSLTHEYMDLMDGCN